MFAGAASALPECGRQAPPRCRCGISLESSSGQRFLFRLGRRPDCLDPCRTRRPVCEPGRSQRLVRLEFRRGLAHGRAPRWLDSRRIEGWLGIHGPRPHPQRITLLGRHQRPTGKLLGLIESGDSCAQVPRLLPLDHQQLTQIRVVKGIGFDRHGPIPSLLPSEKHVLCWRGFTRHRLIINQRQSYRTSDCTSASHVECNPMCSMLGNHVGCSGGQPFLVFSESCSSPQPPPAQVIGDLELLIHS